MIRCHKLSNAHEMPVLQRHEQLWMKQLKRRCNFESINENVKLNVDKDIYE